MAAASAGLLVAGLVAGLAAGCSSSMQSSSGSPSRGATQSAAAPSQQQLYVAKLTRDLEFLDRGVLAYTQVGSLGTGTMTEFEVTVTDVGRGPQQIQLTAYNGMSVFQQDVPTRGRVGVRIVQCENLTCTSESGEIQPVLAKGQQGRWWWTVVAGAPGPALITLRADTYDLGSAVSLSEEIIHVNVTVTPTPSYNAQQQHRKIAAVTKSVVGDMVTIGTIAGGIVAVGGIVGWVLVLTRRKDKAREKPPAPGKDG